MEKVMRDHIVAHLMKNNIHQVQPACVPAREVNDNKPAGVPGKAD
jgi:hypothetical protein